MSGKTLKRQLEIFRLHGGQLRMNEAIKDGMTRYMLYSLKEKGIIEQISRGVYRLAELIPLSNIDLITISSRVPNAVICLISALAYHELTTQIPHRVFFAIPRDSRVPQINYPPIQAHRFSELSYKAGIEQHKIDGVIVRIYSIEKTIVDCFKFRNKIGIDVFLEAIKLYRSQKKMKLNEIIKYAKICRVEQIIRPYLESIV